VDIKFSVLVVRQNFDSKINISLKYLFIKRNYNIPRSKLRESFHKTSRPGEIKIKGIAKLQKLF